MLRKTAADSLHYINQSYVSRFFFCNETFNFYENFIQFAQKSKVIHNWERWITHFLLRISLGKWAYSVIIWCFTSLNLEISFFTLCKTRHTTLSYIVDIDIVLQLVSFRNYYNIYLNNKLVIIGIMTLKNIPFIHLSSHWIWWKNYFWS